MSGPQFNEPEEEQYTQWFNPLSVDQVVDVRVGDSPRATRFRIKPGETKPIPSRYDNVVHRTHNNVVIGGQAPMLVKVGANEKLDPVLDTDLAKAKEANAEASQAVLTQANANAVAESATTRAVEAERSTRARQARTAAALPLPPEAKIEKTEG